MSETVDSPVIDFSALTAEDAPPLTDAIKPDPKASKEPASNTWRKRRAGKDTDRPTRARTVKAKPAIPNRKGQFIKPLTEIYTTVGMIVYVRDQVCGTAFIESAPRCAETLDDLAHRNEVVRRILHNLVTTSEMGAVLMAHLPIILAVGMHHVPAVKTVIGNIPADMVQDIVSNVAKAQNASDATEPAESGEEAA